MGLWIYVKTPDGETIDTDCAGSYTGFHEFRKALAAEIGIDLEKMYDAKADAWPSTDAEPLVHLLNHPDNSGILTTGQCGAIVLRLDAFYALPVPSGYYGTWIEMLRIVLDKAVEVGGTAVFA